jgi:hypothetical protein
MVDQCLGEVLEHGVGLAFFGVATGLESIEDTTGRYPSFYVTLMGKRDDKI